MEDNNFSPSPRPSVTPQPVESKPVDDFTNSPKPRPMTIPVNEPPKEEAKPTPDVEETVKEDISLEDLNSKIAEDMSAETKDKAKAPSVEPEIVEDKKDEESTPEAKDDIVPVTITSSTDDIKKPEEPKQPEEPVTPTPIDVSSGEENSEDKKEIIPGLNTKIEEDSFKDTPVNLSDTSELVAPEQPSPNVADAKLESDITSGKVTSAAYSKPHKKSRGVAILVAVLLAVALIAGAGYAYMQNTKDTKPVNETKPATTTPAVEKDPATTEDIDALNTEIDQTLNKIDDAKDYQENDLTDTTLGL